MRTKIDPEFIKLMEDLLELGLKKYKEESFQSKLEKGDLKRTERLSTQGLMYHSAGHFMEVFENIPHDVFNDIEHQLAAVAINSYMEFCLRKAEKNAKRDLPT